MSQALANVELLKLEAFVPDRVWLYVYPIRFFGMDLTARTTVVRLADGALWVHSPGPLSPELRGAIDALGPVRHVIAPGNFHYLHVEDFRTAYPDASIWMCPGIEKKRPDLPFDYALGDRAPAEWSSEIDQVFVRGAKHITEVVFLDRPSRTLIVTDLIENVGDETVGVDWKLKFWWKAVFHMWNRPRPAPEYRIGWGEKRVVRRALERVMAWDFERIVLSHGDLIVDDAKAVAREAWSSPLSFQDDAEPGERGEDDAT